MHKLINKQIEAPLSFLKLPFSVNDYTDLLNQLENCIRWEEDFFIAYNRRFPIPRLQAWFADNGLQYRYSNNLLQSQDWPEPLSQLRYLIEKTTGYDFNSVLATKYRNGLDSVNWHADDEKELGDNPVIASLSLGATRCFQYRLKGKEDINTLYLKHGDLLLMHSTFQNYWEHQIPSEPNITGIRINLTFRKVQMPNYLL